MSDLDNFIIFAKDQETIDAPISLKCMLIFFLSVCTCIDNIYIELLIFNVLQ
jgi:hypothetical protein